MNSRIENPSSKGPIREQAPRELTIQERLSNLQSAVELFATPLHTIPSVDQLKAGIAPLLFATNPPVPTTPAELRTTQLFIQGSMKAVNLQGIEPLSAEGNDVEAGFREWKYDHEYYALEDDRYGGMDNGKNLASVQERIRQLRQRVLDDGFQRAIDIFAQMWALQQEEVHLEMARYNLKIGNEGQTLNLVTNLDASRLTIRDLPIPDWAASLSKYSDIVSLESQILLDEMQAIGKNSLQLSSYITTAQEFMEAIGDKSSIALLKQLAPMFKTIQETTEEVVDFEIDDFDLSELTDLDPENGFYFNIVKRLRAGFTDQLARDISLREVIASSNDMHTEISKLDEHEKEMLKKAFINVLNTEINGRKNISSISAVNYLLTAQSLGLEKDFISYCKENNVSVSLILGDIGVNVASNLMAFVSSEKPEEDLERLLPNRVAQMVEFALELKGYMKYKDDSWRTTIAELGIPLNELFMAITNSSDPEKVLALQKRLKVIGKNHDIDFVADLMPWYKHVLSNNLQDFYTFIGKSFGHEGIEPTLEQRNELTALFLPQLKEAVTLESFMKIYKTLIVIDPEKFSMDQLNTYQRLGGSNPEVLTKIIEKIGFMSEMGIKPTEKSLSIFFDERFIAIENALENSGLDVETRKQVILDSHYYLNNDEAEKFGLIQKFVSDAESGQALLSRLLIALRRVGPKQLAYKGESMSTLLEIENQAKENMESFYEDYERYAKNKSQANSDYSEIIIMARSVLKDLGIPARKLAGSFGRSYFSYIVVPKGLSRYRHADPQFTEDYLPSVAHLIYERVTAHYPMYKLEKLYKTYMEKTGIDRNWGNLDADVRIARSLWDFVLERARNSANKKTLLWLNESTAPRYFGRDEVDPAFAQKEGIVQGLDDRRVLLNLEEHAAMLKQVAKNIREGRELNANEKAFIKFAMQLFNVGDKTRVLPIHEMKVKSGSNGHEIAKTADHIENLVDLAEILGMDIVFVDVSSSEIGRAQQNIRAFMKLRGVPLGAEGKIAEAINDGYNADNADDDGYEITSKTKYKHFRKTKVTFINFDPNSDGDRASGDDAHGFTVRNAIDERGIYAHTQEPKIYIKRQAGLTNIEIEWKRRIVESVMRAVHNNA